MRLWKSLFVTGILLSSRAAFACPAIEGIPDFNCDGDLQISVMGDSLVSGFGDTKYKNKGGYPLRTQKTLKKAAIQNLGKQGLRTGGLLDLLSEAFDQKKRPDVKAALRNSDVVVIDIGRNDYFLFGTPQETYRNIILAANGIRKEVKKLEKVEPIVVIAVLAPPNRTGQGVFIRALNKLILKGNTTKTPADLRFDTFSKKLLGPDQIHPTSVGYDSMAKIFVKYLKGPLAKKMMILRPDTDLDGLPDPLETAVYNTDPAVADTDGDGHSDGQEVLTLHTDPLVANP